MYTEELLSDTMKLTGEFLATRSKLLVEKENREILNTKLFKLQAELTNKHENTSYGGATLLTGNVTYPPADAVAGSTFSGLHDRVPRWRL